jgi:hypothetical protein
MPEAVLPVPVTPIPLLLEPATPAPVLLLVPLTQALACPCGSGKKHKRVLPSARWRSGIATSHSKTEPGAVAKMTAQAVRSRAFGRLMAFAEKPAFAANLAAASHELWGA